MDADDEDNDGGDVCWSVVATLAADLLPLLNPFV